MPKICDENCSANSTCSWNEEKQTYRYSHVQLNEEIQELLPITPCTHIHCDFVFFGNHVKGIYIQTGRNASLTISVSLSEFWTLVILITAYSISPMPVECDSSQQPNLIHTLGINVLMNHFNCKKNENMSDVN